MSKLTGSESRSRCMIRWGGGGMGTDQRGRGCLQTVAKKSPQEELTSELRSE